MDAVPLLSDADHVANRQGAMEAVSSEATSFSTSSSL